MSIDAGTARERIEAIAQSISLSAAMLKHKGQQFGSTPLQSQAECLAAISACAAQLAAHVERLALPPVPAPGAALVRVTTAARDADEAWAAAHEFDNPESAAAAEAHATELAKNASAPTVLIVDKFPKFLTRKHLGRLDKMMTDGVRVNVLRNGIPCFVGPNNRTTWLPPGWSQEKIQDFLARQCKLDISKLLVLSSARAVYRKHATSSAAALALAAADTEFSDPSDSEFSDDPHVGFFESPQFKQVLAFFMLLVRAFNVVMASLLVVFVPQRCPGVPGSSDPSMLIPHDCTMHENFNDLTSINTAALWLNFLCLALFLLMFYIEFKREGFMVEFLDLDQFKSLQSLPMELKSHYNIRSILRRFNVGLFTLSVTAIILSAVNLVVSAVVLWRDYYAGTRSITVYVTNLLLLLTVIVSAVNNSWVGLQTEEALSCVDVTPVSYNCVDDDDSATAQKETELEPREYDCLGLAQPLMAKCWPLER